MQWSRQLDHSIRISHQPHPAHRVQLQSGRTSPRASHTRDRDTAQASRQGHAKTTPVTQGAHKCAALLRNGRTCDGMHPRSECRLTTELPWLATLWQRSRSKTAGKKSYAMDLLNEADVDTDGQLSKESEVTPITGILGAEGTIQVAQHIMDPATGEATTGGTWVSGMQSHPLRPQGNYLAAYQKDHNRATTTVTLRDTHPSPRLGPCPAFNAGNCKGSISKDARGYGPLWCQKGWHICSKILRGGEPCGTPSHGAHTCQGRRWCAVLTWQAIHITRSSEVSQAVPSPPSEETTRGDPRCTRQQAPGKAQKRAHTSLTEADDTLVNRLTPTRPDIV